MIGFTFAVVGKLTACGNSELSPEQNKKQRSAKSKDGILLSSDSAYRNQSAPPIDNTSVPETGNPSVPEVGKPSIPPEDYSGNSSQISQWECKNLVSSKPINAENNQVIEGKIFQGNGGDSAAITVNGKSNVTIKDCLFINFKHGVYISHSSNVNIIGNRFENGQTFVGSTLSNNIRVEYNEALNVGHFRIGSLAGNFASLSKTLHGSVSYNIIDNKHGESNHVEDCISVYKSSGTADKPFMIKGNHIRGRGPSESGSGILVGDMGGSYFYAEDNILVNAGQIGMGIAGGSHNRLVNNKLFHAKGTGYYSVGAMGVRAQDGITGWEKKEPTSPNCRPRPETCTWDERINWETRNSAGCYYCPYPSVGHVVSGNKINWWSSLHNNYFGISTHPNSEAVVENNTGRNAGFPDKSIDASILPPNMFEGNGPNYFSTRHNADGTCK